MPNKNGKDAYDEIRRSRPDIRTLFISGYTADIIHKKGIFDPELDFLKKPLSESEVLWKVREILDRQSPASVDRRNTAVLRRATSHTSSSLPADNTSPDRRRP